LVWLKVIERKPLCTPERLGSIRTECSELIAIFVRSVQTAEQSIKD
jgi:hypothetical protein